MGVAALECGAGRGRVWGDVTLGRRGPVWAWCPRRLRVLPVVAFGRPVGGLVF